MKIGTITYTNQKGQIVIPKKLRDKLNITPEIPLHVAVRDQGIYIHPVSHVMSQNEKNKAFLQLLKKTQGMLAGREFDPRAKERRKVELGASKKRKQAW